MNRGTILRPVRRIARSYRLLVPRLYLHKAIFVQQSMLDVRSTCYTSSKTRTNAYRNMLKVRATHGSLSAQTYRCIPALHPDETKRHEVTPPGGCTPAGLAAPQEQQSNNPTCFGDECQKPRSLCSSTLPCRCAVFFQICSRRAIS